MPSIIVEKSSKLQERFKSPNDDTILLVIWKRLAAWAFIAKQWHLSLMET